MKTFRKGLRMVVAGGLFLPAAALADVAVDNKDVQVGLYVQESCKPQGMEGFNECQCMADIHVPVIKGMKDADKEKQINALFGAMADRYRCAGKESDQEVTDEPSSSTYNFDITFQSQQFMGLRFESWSYSGGAHGNGFVEGVVLDTDNGKVLTISEIFSDLPTLNKYIYEALSAEPEGEVFHDAIEAFKGEFVTPTECKSCAVLLTGEGVKVVFQTYAVSSFANGPMEVLIEEKLIGNPAIREALKNQKPLPPTPPAEQE